MKIKLANHWDASRWIGYVDNKENDMTEHYKEYDEKLNTALDALGDLEVYAMVFKPNGEEMILIPNQEDINDVNQGMYKLMCVAYFLKNKEMVEKVASAVNMIALASKETEGNA